jgi:general secretion pathway protein K
MRNQWGQRGIALVAVLWVVALLAVIAGTVAYSTRIEGRLARNMMAVAQAGALAEGGIYLGIGELLRGDAAERPPLDGTPWDMELGGRPLRVAVLDERGKLDINHASGELLEGLVSSVAPDADAAAVAAAILDWRDEDDLRAIGGAEDDDYERMGLPYGARDGPFLMVEELQQVMGVTPELYEGLAHQVTVYSGVSQVNPQTAGREVLLAVPGLNEPTVDDFLQQRLESVTLGSQRPTLELTAGGDYFLSSNSGVYSITAQATTEDGVVARRRAVVQIAGDVDGPFRLLAWYRDGPDLGKKEIDSEVEPD